MKKQRNCAWCKNGRCVEESICQRLHCRPECSTISRCKRYITAEQLTKLCNKRADDRPLTRDTRGLVVMYHAEGCSVAQIAFLLCRSVPAIEKILTEEGVLNG